MTYGIFGKNRKFEDSLIFVETSSITIYERFAMIKMPIIGYKSDISQFLVTHLL